MKFCVYLTIYKGNKLPPFYIGSTSADRIDAGYCGSVASKKYSKIWKREIRKDRNLFTTRIISVCENRKDAYERERSIQKHFNIITNPMYINLSYGHKNTAGGWNAGLPAWNKGRKWSDKTRKRISEAKKNPSAETRAKISLANKGRIPPSTLPGVGAKISAAKRGVKLSKPAWNKGKTGVYSEEARRAMSLWRTGRKNPIISEANRRRVGMKYNKTKKTAQA